MNNGRKNRLRVAAGMLAGLAILVIAGCRHPCGYVGIRSVIVPLEGEGRVERTAGTESVRLSAPVTGEKLSLGLLTEEQEVTLGPARRETYGYRTYVPCTWYSPILKPIAAVTLVAPICFSFRDPHSHAGGNWRLRDYGRDVIAWFNICSGMPVGPRKMETQERLIKSAAGEYPVLQRSIPAPGRTVLLMLDDQEVARGVSDAEGIVSFDLAPHLRPEMAQAGQLFHLKLQRQNGTEEIFDFSLDKETAAAWLTAHPAP